MNSVCVVHLTPVEGSMQASARVARYLATVLGVPLVDGPVSLDQFMWGAGVMGADGKPIDGARDVTLFFVNGPVAFCGFRDVMGTHLLPRVRRVVWVQQDYTITLPPNMAYSRPTKAETPFRAEFHKVPHVHLWSTCMDVLAKRQDKQVPGCEYDEYVNWNALTYAPMPADWHQHGERLFEVSERLFYYGALRAGRTERLRHFLWDMNVGANTVVSASHLTAATKLQWEGVAAAADICRPVKGETRYVPTNGNVYGYSPIIPEIAMHRHSLYVADEQSNEAFHSLANRFYEVLSTPFTVLWLDAAGAATYDRAGLRDWGKYAVADSLELACKMAMNRNKLRAMAERQRAEWFITDPFKALGSNLRDAIKFVTKEWKL